MISKLDHALALADQGFYVFPCDPQTNTPTVPWRERSTRNPATIKDWWVCPILGFDQDWNIGIDCYKSGVTVIDVDVKDGKKGKESYEQLESAYGWGSTRVQHTPSGGLHRIYRAQGFRNSVELLAPGIDVRGDGGFYIAAGSTRQDKTYTLFEDIEPKPLPTWLEEKLTALGKAIPPEARDSSKSFSSDNADDIASAIEFLAEHEPAVEGHGGDNHTFVTFCMLKEKGISIQTAIDLVEEHWNPRCSPPWDHDALIQKANSAYRSAHNATGAKSPHAEFDIPQSSPTAKVVSAFSPSWEPKIAAQIPLRNWVVPNLAPAGKVALLVAEPGGSKSTWSLGTALSKASGRNIMGFDPGEQGAVAIFNNEDDFEEMERRLAAAMQAYGLNRADLSFPDATDIPGSLIFLNSGEQRRLRIAKRLTDGRLVPDDLTKMIEYVKNNNIKLVIVDPLSETHAGQENSNEDMIKVASMYRYLAQQTQCAVLLIHHTRKPDSSSSEGHSGNPNSARGASSLIGVARVVFTLGVITKKDCARYNIPEKEQSFHIVLEQAKANMAAPGAMRFFYRRHGEIINAGRDDPDGESVGILKPLTLSEKPTLTPLNDLIVRNSEIVLDSIEPLRISDLVTQLQGFAEFSDKQPGSLDRAVRRLFNTEVFTGNTGRFYIEDRIDGKKTTKYISFERFADPISDVI